MREGLPRVLHVISTLEKAGGAQRLLLSILPGLPGYRHDLAVLSGALELREELEAAGVRVLDLRKRSFFDPIGVREIRALVREGRYELVHAHLVRAEIVAGLAVGPLPEVKLLLFKQGLNDDVWWRRPLLRGAQRKIARRADRVVCTSDAMLDWFTTLEPASKPKTVRIHNGIDVAAIAAASDAADTGALRRALGVPPAAPMLLSVGRLVEEKRHDVLVRALAEPVLAKTGAVAVLVGRGEWREKLEADARSASVLDRVIFAGVRSDVPALLGACDLFVLPSRWEGFGLVAAEAMAASRAVVATRVFALPEVVEDGVTGTLVPPADPPALSAAIASLLADPARRAAFGAAGRARAQKLFSRERMLADWRAEYQRLLPAASAEGAA